jgi:hypothetical protein
MLDDKVAVGVEGGGGNEENEANMGKGSANGGLATSSTGSALITELSPPQQYTQQRIK